MITIVVLGAPDPEMSMITELAAAAGFLILEATVDGKRCHPGNVYRCDPIDVARCKRLLAPDRTPLRFVFVECSANFTGELPEGSSIVVIDHHRPGDSGFGRPPAEYFEASSVGQFWELVHPKEKAPKDVMLCAAADHCLGHAYAGRCPGVARQQLLDWRVAQRAAFLNKSADDVRADIEAARTALHLAPRVILGGLNPADGHCGYECCSHHMQEAADMRGRHVPELPEAGCIEGMCYVADAPAPFGERKVVCQGGTPEQIRAFMTEWAPEHDLTGIYGDPERGFAGGIIK